MPCLAASGAGTADVASARDTVVAAMSEVAAEPYTEEPEHVAAVAEEMLQKLRGLLKCNNVSRKVLNSDSFEAQLSVDSVTLINNGRDESKQTPNKYSCCWASVERTS
ncbi:hypothetical protein MRB53_007967 [Persea americana]|uniref:Uncharacterized protein n=1 Tax=Persea americana TaxID=3435 RepID=A0ACC2MKP6_PERAE|nr:hypothetical protein MRB53_007967 [Persea americana]